VRHYAAVALEVLASATGDIEGSVCFVIHLEELERVSTTHDACTLVLFAGSAETHGYQQAKEYTQSCGENAQKL
jgi:hypothetical protein